MLKIMFGLLVVAVFLLALYSNRKHRKSLAAKLGELAAEEVRTRTLAARESLAEIKGVNNELESELKTKEQKV